jgi:hypothetical protein
MEDAHVGAQTCTGLVHDNLRCTKLRTELNQTKLNRRVKVSRPSFSGAKNPKQN